MELRLVFFYVVVYGFFWWFHPRGLPMGLLVSLGLRYRLLWFGSSGELFLGFYLWVLDGLKVEA